VISRALAARDPDNIQWTSDVVISLVKLSQAVGSTRREPYLAEALERVLILEERGALTADQTAWPDFLRDALDSVRQ